MISDDADIVLDPLFVGLTRPAMVLGVPYGAFITEVLAVAMIFLTTGSPLYILLALPIHGVMYLLSAHDPGMFASIFLWMQTIGRCRNKAFWGDAASFSPLQVKKWGKE